MRLNDPDFWTLLRGDLRLFMRDHIAILLAVVLPIVSIPLMLGGVEGATQAGQDQLDNRLLQVHAPEEIEDWLEAGDHIERTATPYLDSPEGDVESADAELKLPGSHTSAVIRFRGNDTDSREARTRLVDVLQREQSRQQARHWHERGLEILPEELLIIEERDLSTATARAGHSAGKWVPLMLFMLICTGGLYTALDLFAGERERGTLETLLVTRLSRGTILAARFILVLIFCLCTAWLALGSLWVGVSQGWIRLGTSAADQSALPLALMGETALLCIPLAGLLGAILIATATLAPDLKSGQALSMPVMLIVSGLAAVTALPDVELSPLLCLVPLSGLALGIRDSLAGQLTAGNLALVFGATTVHAILALTIAHRLLQRESILFQSTTSHRRRKGRMGLEAGVTYGIAMVLFWFLGQLAMDRNLIGGMLFNQAGILGGTALAVIAWLGLPAAPVLQLRWPRIPDAGLALLIGLSAPCLSWLIMELQSSWIPVNEATVGAEFLAQDLSLPEVLLLFAFLPSICEELLFRGTIQGLIRKSTGPWARCLIVGSLFGLFHMSVARIFPTGILGIVLCMAAWRSRSLLVPMIIHFLHNAVVLVLSQSEEMHELPGLQLVLPGAALCLASLSLMGRGRAP